ncbi:MAG TPA: glucose-1-phosphate adenylyltransferase [Firmicutes bacterium]|nr:glucose-1-phosphate adenylyltransferase [Bacillota bacterium]
MSKQCVAMILAGGKGTRLQALTKKIAKPAVYFGGKYRIIDFSLSNVANSGIDTCGVLIQYESIALNNYIGNGEKWGFNGVGGKCLCLSPRQTEEGANWYKGTADAIYQNIDFLDDEDPEYVLILSGDHIYKTVYNDMLELHIKSGASCTISVLEVPLAEASRFGILEVDNNDVITKFVEKPKVPKSNLASMGVYIFTYKELRKALLLDAKDEDSSHDFGKNIIPYLLDNNKKVVAYRFSGYWRDVGTLNSLHQANMELLPSNRNSDTIRFGEFPQIYSEDTHSLPQFISKSAVIKNSLINQGAKIYGEVNSSVISNEVYIAKGAKVINSVLMPGVNVLEDAYVNNAIIGPKTTIKKGEIINKDNEDVILIDYGRGLTK